MRDEPRVSARNGPLAPRLIEGAEHRGVQLFLADLWAKSWVSLLILRVMVIVREADLAFPASGHKRLIPVFPLLSLALGLLLRVGAWDSNEQIQ